MHVTVNAAISTDGKLSTPDRDRVVISGPEDFDRLDRLRADHDAVAVGIGTVLADDPSLTVDGPDRIASRRDRGAPPQPTRVVVDSRCRVPADARILDDAAPTTVLTSKSAPIERRGALRDAGASVIVAGVDRVSLPEAVDALESDGHDRLLVEGGGELLFSVFEAGLADELLTFVGPIVIGGRESPTLADGEGFTDPDAFPELERASARPIDGGVLIRWHVG
jgi:2,5-diamino-6-(ribosylamino)-4(3H)-pyrimidinone 5'-phosphate reductase